VWVGVASVAVVAGSFLAGSFGLGFNPWSQTQATQAEADTLSQALPVATLEIAPIDRYQIAQTYTGIVVARRTSELGFERSGQVTAILVDEGDTVAAGDWLAQLDTRNLQTQRQALMAQRRGAIAQLQELETGPRFEDIAAAQAVVADLEQQLALAEVTRDRWQSLYQEGAIAQQQFDERDFNRGAIQARLDQAQSQLAELVNGTRQEQILAQRATVQQLKAQIDAVDVDLDKSLLKAPFAGTISRRQVDEGVVIAPGQTLVTLVEQQPWEARIGVPVHQAQTLGVGGTYNLTVGGQTYGATLKTLLPELDDATRTVTVVLTFNQVGSFKPGEIAQLQITDDIATDTPAYWLPTTALVQGERGLWSSYTVVPTPGEIRGGSSGFQVELQVVEVLYTEGDRALVRGTLQPGDQVIANGTHRIVPGQQVQPSPSL
jgi:RND family efflux transporter MFP subunit